MIRAALALAAIAGCASRSEPPASTELPALEPQAVARPPAQQPLWLTDEAAAFARALREHKLLVIDFYAMWAAPSEELDRVLAGPDVAPLLATAFVPLRFDVSNGTDEDVARRQRYGVETLPYVVVSDADGTVRDRLDHLADGPTIRALLERTR